MKGQKSKVILTSAAAVALAAVLIVIGILIYPKNFSEKPSSLWSSVSEMDRLPSISPAEGSSLAKEELSTTKTDPEKDPQSTGAANGTDSTDSTGSASATGVSGESDEEALPYIVTAQFPLTDTDVFAFPQFASDTYTDIETGRELPYRLYVPKDYDGSQSYPIFFFCMERANAAAITTSTSVCWKMPIA